MENGVIIFASVKVNELVLQKAVVFNPDTTVKEAMEQIAIKCSLSDPEEVTKGNMIFIPSKTGGEGTYLQNLDAKILSCHQFTSRDIIEMRPAAFHVIINYLDEEFKQPPLDLEWSVFEVLQRLCKQFQCGSHHHFELFFLPSPLQPPKLLIGNKTLGSQLITSNMTIFMRRKKGISDRIFSRNEKKSKKSSVTKESKKSDDEKIFGQPLTNALKRSGEIAFSVPPLVTLAIDYIERNAMEVEGIFRKPGLAIQIEELKLKLNSSEVDADFSNISDPHLVCSLLKQYLRELPEPIIPFALYDQFLEVADLFENEETKEGEEKLRGLTKQLPLPNYHLLKKLTSFLLKVSTFEPQNKMSARNLATVFGPNLLRSNNDDVLVIMRDSPRINEITYWLIILSDLLFPDRGQEGGKIIRPVSVVRSEQKESKRRRATFTPTSSISQYMGYCKVLIEFPQFESGLTTMKCKEGDIIAVVQMLESGWGYGKVYTEEVDLVGFFPSNFCSSIVNSIADLNLLDDEVVVKEKADTLEGLFISQFQAHCDDLFQQFSLLTSMLAN